MIKSPAVKKSALFFSGQLRTLIAEAQFRGLRFVYALSPGQDIVFSSSSDVTLLKRKLRQVQAHQGGGNLTFSLSHPQIHGSSLSLSGVRPGLPGIRHPVRWHRSLLVPGRQRGLLFIRPRSGLCNQRGLSVLGWTTCLPILPHRWEFAGVKLHSFYRLYM